jgi:hypothetical protein
MMDDDDTIAADPDEEETAVSVAHITDGSTPGENQEVGLGVGDDD